MKILENVTSAASIAASRRCKADICNPPSGGFLEITKIEKGRKCITLRYTNIFIVIITCIL
jgi:hypothetical protein